MVVPLPAVMVGSAVDRADDIAARPFIHTHLEQTPFLSILQQVAEGSKSVGRLGKVRSPSFERLLDHGAPNTVSALFNQRFSGGQHQLDALFLQI